MSRVRVLERHELVEFVFLFEVNSVAMLNLKLSLTHELL